MRTGGFDVFNYWIMMYDIVANRKIPVSARNVSTTQKLAFNSCVKRLKDQYKLRDGEEVKALINFAYTHNPLGLDNVADYGKMLNLELAVSHFIYWKSLNKDRILCSGVVKAVSETVPKSIVIDRQIIGLLTEFHNKNVFVEF